MESISAIIRMIKNKVSPVLESTWCQVCEYTRYVFNRNMTVSGPNETNYLVVAGERTKTQVVLESVKMGLSYGVSGCFGTMAGVYWRDTTKQVIEDGLKGKSKLVKMLSYGPSIEQINKAYASGYQWGSVLGGFGASLIFDLSVYCTKTIIRYMNIAEARSFQQVLESQFSCKAYKDWDIVNTKSKVSDMVSGVKQAVFEWSSVWEIISTNIKSAGLSEKVINCIGSFVQNATLYTCIEVFSSTYNCSGRCVKLAIGCASKVYNSYSEGVSQRAGGLAKNMTSNTINNYVQ